MSFLKLRFYATVYSVARRKCYINFSKLVILRVGCIACVARQRTLFMYLQWVLKTPTEDMRL